jgi:hypothetical protein
MNRTIGMFVDGFVFNERTIYLVQETFEAALNQAGLSTLILSIFIVRTFSQFILFNLLIVNSLDYLKIVE